MHKSRVTPSVSVTALRYVALFLLSTSVPTWATFPSRNGRIVFSANISGSWQLYTIDPDGTGMVQITNLPPAGGINQPGLGQPAFSPDGTRIVFSYAPLDNKGNPAPDLYVINADGTELTRLTHDGLSTAPHWSPDGRRIVFARTSTRTGANTIVTMRADGTGVRQVLTTDIWDSYGPLYTPSGGQIVNYSQNGGLVAAVWIMRVNGTQQLRLTPAPLEGFPSDVSPDGEHILLGDHGNSPFVLSTDIFVMNQDGKNLKRLTHLGTTHHDLDAGYSPDGSKIVFASDRLSSDASLDLFTMDSDGSHIERIATGLTVGGCPSLNCVTPNWGPKPVK